MNKLWYLTIPLTFMFTSNKGNLSELEYYALNVCDFESTLSVTGAETKMMNLSEFTEVKCAPVKHKKSFFNGASGPDNVGSDLSTYNPLIVESNRIKFKNQSKNSLIYNHMKESQQWSRRYKYKI